MTLEQLARILSDGNHSLAVASADGSVTTYDSRGVADLYRLITCSPDKLDGAMVADKVVGKGAAALMAAGHIKALLTRVISSPALKMLEDHDIEVKFDQLTDSIINRQGTGPCPVESLCKTTDDPRECIGLIHDFLIEKGIINQ